MKTISQWKKSKEYKRISKCSEKELFYKDFFRNPFRAIRYDPDVFLSPADGVVVYNKIIKPNEPFINIKGNSFSLNEVMISNLNTPCLVIGIFMTIYDIHINRMPTDGFLTTSRLEPLQINNLSMRAIESAIINETPIKSDDMEYILYNERVVNRIYYPKFNQEYFIIQIADAEVNAISSFVANKSFLNQGKIFSFIHLGSQTDIIIPITKNKIVSLLPSYPVHVEAGVDRIAKIEEV